MNKQTFRTIIFAGLFIIPFVPFLVSSSFFFPYITTKAFAWRIIVEIVFASWLVLALIDKDARPKKSIILYAIGVFLSVIGLADLLGVAPAMSFWSNFERMEGFLMLLHLGMFFAVISSVFNELDWKRWWNTSLVASFVMVLYCTLQIIGVKTINQGGVRVDGTLGNAIYLAVYMLFHIFISMLFLWRERKDAVLRWIYGLLILSQFIILYYTATRGAILGLICGLFVMALLNVRNREEHAIKKVSVVVLVGLVVMIGFFVALRNTSFVTGSPVLSRFSSLNVSQIKYQGRYFVWPMAFKGFEERPILGWGQDSFPYVFQKYYQPEMFRLEPWFDRAHNIFLDWLVSGGLLGLLSYLALYVALLILIWRKGGDIPYTEKSILTGLIVAYFFHNIFVFDHLVSYILFFSLLAYIHYRKSVEPLWSTTLSEIQVKGIALPLVGIALIFSLYYVNVKPIMGNFYLIEALKTLQTPGQTLSTIENFKKAYKASSLGRPEVAEHMAGNIYTILTADTPMPNREDFFNFAKQSIVGLAADKDLRNNARFQLIAGSFLSTTGLLDESLAHLQAARTLMPNKQQIYYEIGAVYINKKEPLKALEVFKVAYDLAPESQESETIYLLGAIYAGDRNLETRLITELTPEIANGDSRVASAYRAVGR